MNTGDKIRKARELRGMTMREIGLEMHYPYKSAAVRIAQYEAGLRQPNSKTLDQMAEVLNVNRKALAGPEGYEVEDVIRFLFDLEDIGYDVVIRPEGEKLVVVISSDELTAPLIEWNEIRTRYRNQELREKEYITWKFCWEKKPDNS